MPRIKLTILVLIGVMTCSLFCPSRLAWAAGTKAKSGKKTASTGNAKMERLVKYYIRTYSDYLQSKDWKTRAMAVISISKIGDPRVTDILLEMMNDTFTPQTKPASIAAVRSRNKFLTVSKRPYLIVFTAKKRKKQPPSTEIPMQSSGHSFVKILAWEALHARALSLTAEQRKRWEEGTVELAKKKQFRGAMRLSMINLLTPQGPTVANRQIYNDLFKRTNSMYPRDMPVINSMRTTFGLWQSSDIARSMIKKFQTHHNSICRGDYILRGMKTDIPAMQTWFDEGSTAMYIKTVRAWDEWLRNTTFTPPKPGSIKPYKGTSTLLDPPLEIKDPGDRKWRKDLEIGEFKIRRLDVTFVVDSTGTMREVVNWIRRDIKKILRAFKMVCPKTRIGVVFYRDRDKKSQFVVQVHPLTPNASLLVRILSKASVRGGGDKPEAVYDGLYAAIHKQKWARGDETHKVIILAGDAPPHKETMGKIETLVKEAASDGFSFFCIKTLTRYSDDNLTSFDQIAKWGNGKSVWVDFITRSLLNSVYSGAAGIHIVTDDVLKKRDVYLRGRYKKQYALVPDNKFEPRPERMILSGVLTTVLRETYKERAKPFTSVLLEYLEPAMFEIRKKFGSKAEKEAARKRRVKASKKRKRRKGGGGPQ